MRGKRNRHWCESTLEANSISCHRIDVWSFNLLVAVTTDMVGAQGIDGDENNVEGRFFWLFRRNLKRGKSRQGKDNSPEIAEHRGVLIISRKSHARSLNSRKNAVVGFYRIGHGLNVALDQRQIQNEGGLGDYQPRIRLNIECRDIGINLLCTRN
jgi:hypothetical protein